MTTFAQPQPPSKRLDSRIAFDGAGRCVPRPVPEMAVTLEGLAEWAVMNDQGRCFSGWLKHWVKDYFEFHARQGTLAYVRSSPSPLPSPPGEGEAMAVQPEIAAIGVGWQLNACELRDPDFVARPWRWQQTKPDGDAFLFCDIVGSRRHLPALMAEFMVRFPNWRKLRLMGIRRGRAVEYHAEQLVRRLR